MATNNQIGGGGSLFVSEDKQIILELLDINSLPVNMVGWTLEFLVRTKDTAIDPPVLVKTPAVTGVFNSVRAVNTQRAVVTLLTAEMALLKAKSYRYSFARLDIGNDTILSYGDFVVEIATIH